MARAKKILTSGLILTMFITSLLAIHILPVAANGVPSEEIISYPCTKDAFIVQGNPGTNFNTEQLAVISYDSNNTRSYLGFNFADIPQVKILNATLKVYVNQSNAIGRTYEVYSIWQSWNEIDPTWNNGLNIWWNRLDTKTVSTVPGWVEFNVTQAIQNYVCGWWGLDGFVIKDESEGNNAPVGSIIFSREYTDEALRPYLEVGLSFSPDFLLNTGGWQTVIPGDHVGYGGSVKSLNGFKGTINMSLTGVPASVTATIQPESFYLTGEMGIGVDVHVGTSASAGVYTLTVTTTSGSLTHSQDIYLDVKNPIVVRKLPAGEAKNVTGSDIFPFDVTLTYNASFIDTTGLIITENLEKNVAFNDFGPDPVGIDFVYKTNSTYDWGTQLKWVIVSKTQLPTFNVTYSAYINYTGPEQNMPHDVGFWGNFNAVLTNGTKYDDKSGNPILRDSRVTIQRGLPGGWDDDGRVDDWELLDVINAWATGYP